MPRTTVIIVAKYGSVKTLLTPVASLYVSPGANQNSWNIYLARRVAVSSEVRQNAETARINSE